MRIIRRVLILAIILFAPVTPHIALAADGQDSNETQINFKIEDNLVIDNGILKNKQDLRFESMPYKYEGYVPVKTEREIQVEELISNYQEKKDHFNLPEGPFNINASAYTAAADECGKSDGITASGIKVMEHETIACPPQFPMGTRLSIEGLGTYICEDRGGAIKGNHIDIYMETKNDAFKFGRQDLVAEVVE